MDDLFKTLQNIHENIKKRFVYVSDIKRWGTNEHWERYDEIPETGEIRGDCDCFALACRRECRKLEIPSRLVHVLTETKEGHLILSVDKYILDNRMDYVVKKESLDGYYAWIRISGFEKGDPWHMINDPYFDIS